MNSQEITQSITNPDFKDEKLILTTHQAAELFSKTSRTWRGWNELGYIPQPIRIGQTLYWRYAELRDWVDAGCPNRRSWRYSADKKSGAKKL